MVLFYCSQYNGNDGVFKREFTKYVKSGNAISFFFYNYIETSITSVVRY